MIFEQYLGTGRTLSLILGGVNVTVYALAAFASFFTIERFGRRKMFLGGTIGQCVSLIITMACLIPGEPKSALNGAVFGLCESGGAFLRHSDLPSANGFLLQSSSSSSSDRRGSSSPGCTLPRSTPSGPAPTRMPSRRSPTGFST